jgi:hypothetical protein
VIKGGDLQGSKTTAEDLKVFVSMEILLVKTRRDGEEAKTHCTDVAEIGIVLVLPVRRQCWGCKGI